jgi:hypothetical protein
LHKKMFENADVIRQFKEASAAKLYLLFSLKLFIVFPEL